jgi:hypothetical protein
MPKPRESAYEKYTYQEIRASITNYLSEIENALGYYSMSFVGMVLDETRGY